MLYFDPTEKRLSYAFRNDLCFNTNIDDKRRAREAENLTLM